MKLGFKYYTLPLLCFLVWSLYWIPRLLSGILYSIPADRMAQGSVEFHNIKQDMWRNEPGTAAWDQFSRFKYIFPHYNQQPAPKMWMDTMIGFQIDEDWSQLHKHLLH